MFKDFLQDPEDKQVALVEPTWAYKIENRNWQKYMNEMYVPVGLLKLAALLRGRSARVQLLRGSQLPKAAPDLVLITSLFTYWYQPVWQAVHAYRLLYPESYIVVGGIYASLMPDHCKESGCDEVYSGLVEEAESCLPAYDLVPSFKMCVIHASRGCIFRQENVHCACCKEENRRNNTLPPCKTQSKTTTQPNTEQRNAVHYNTGQWGKL